MEEGGAHRSLFKQRQADLWRRAAATEMGLSALSEAVRHVDERIRRAQDCYGESLDAVAGDVEVLVWRLLSVASRSAS